MMNIEGVVLAGGYSTRAGTFKMTLPLAGKTLIEQTIQGMYDLCSRIIVVGGHRFEKIAFLSQRYRKIQLVFNKDYQSGMFSSIKEGVKHLEGERFFLIPGDYPLARKEVYEKMLQVKGDIVVPTFGGRKGHPVLMKSSLAQELLRETGDSNLKIFIDRKGYTLVDVADEGILVDVDTVTDYERAVSRYENPGRTKTKRIDC